MQIEIKRLHAGDREHLARLDGGNGWNADSALWASYLAQQSEGARDVAIAWSGERPLGYGTLIWRATYAPFRDADIPEINNLGVDISMRNQGVATALIAHFETKARAAGKRTIGLGVGLYADYGPAQRLYFRLGYRPDGNGLTYNEKPVPPGDHVRVDDDLLIWLTKPL